MISTEGTRISAMQVIRDWELTELDGAVHGITFYGRWLVVASGACLLRVVPDTGRVVDRLETHPDPGGVTYDGRHFWQHSEGRLQKVDPRTGFVLKSIAPGLGEIAGLAGLGDDLLVLHAGGRALARVETLNATSLANAAVDEAFPPLRGLAWAAGELWSSAGGALCRVDHASARALARFALPAGVEAIDLTADAEGRLWTVDGVTRQVRAVARPRE